VSARLTGATARVVIASSPRALDRTVEAVRASRLPAWMPRATLTRASGARSIRRLVRCRAVRHTRAFSGLDMVSVLTIDLERGLPAVDADALMTSAETVYASPTALYVATRRWFAPQRIATGEPPRNLTTEIHRLDTSGRGRTAYRSSGEVPGFLLSQWALSEHAGHLRVASTDVPDWWGGGGEAASRVTVLRERDRKLAEVGRVGGLGHGERIFAVRFIGDVGYVVTFRQVDPLYTISLADPANPRVLGELKLLGYSAYLHPVGDDLLLGVGQDATEQGRLQGAQLSLFDVSDPRAPQRLHQRTLGRGSSSAVEWDHRAFLHWPATGLAVLPVDGAAAGFRVGRGGIEPVGAVTQPGTINRSAVAAGRLLTVSEAGVTSSRLATLGDGTWLPFGGGQP
jgi:Beta propeller domain